MRDFVPDVNGAILYGLQKMQKNEENREPEQLELPLGELTQEIVKEELEEEKRGVLIIE